MVYEHKVVNVSGENIGCHIDLSKIVMIERPIRNVIPVHVAGLRKPVELLMTDFDQYIALIDAWKMYSQRI